MTAPRVFHVVASHPRFCTACGGARVMRLVRTAGLRAVGLVPCPHCGPRLTGLLPILAVPYRVDTLTGDTGA